MSDNPRSEIAIEYFDVMRLPTVEMNGQTIKYAVTNDGTLNFIVTTIDHIGFTVADQTDKIWWPLAHITDIQAGLASEDMVWDIRIWHHDIEDPLRDIMSAESYDKLKQAWLSHRF